jgi:Carboxypeptidase regulatory-like domain
MHSSQVVTSSHSPRPRVSPHHFVLCLFLCLLAVISPRAIGQSTGGRVLGRVLDPSGAVVPDVTLILTNDDSGKAMAVQSSKIGDYIFPAVPVGTYRLEAQLAGFQNFTATGILVNLNATVTYDVKLTVGANTQAVEVTAEAPLVDSTTTQLGAVINERAVQNLPLNSRDTYQLLQLQPGVQGVGGSDLFYGSDKPGAVSVNGGRGRSNNFSVNGGDGNDLFVNSPGIEPSPDAVQEFKVITNTFDAEYGRNSGAIINVVTKSGTNQFHGSIYDYVRNSVFDAKGYFNLTTPDDTQNQFGATIGGPIRHDKTFFFVSYEGRQLVEGIASDRTRVPTEAERTGQFAGFAGTLSDLTVSNILQNRAGCANAIAAAGGVAPTPGTPWASIFPTSIPTPCFDPVAANLIDSYVPLPNVGGLYYQASPNQHSRENQGTVRVDHTFNDHNTFTGYYYVDDGFDENPFTRFQAVTNNLLPGFGSNNATRNQQINLSDTWTLSATTQNEARITYYREGQLTFLAFQRTGAVTDSCTGAAANYCFNGNPDTSLIDDNGNPIATPNAKLGITPGLPPSREGVPYIDISGGFTIGNDSEGSLPQVGNTYSLTDNFSKVIGQHSLKFGGDFRIQHFDQTLYYNVNGYFSYSGGGQNDLEATDSTGAGTLFPNYLLGLPDNYSQGSPQTENIRANALYLFAQDSYKVKPNLTLNYGLRWELNYPLADAAQRVQTFRPGQATQIFPCQLNAENTATIGNGTSDCGPGSANEAYFPLGLVIPGDKGVPKGLTATYYKAFAPRIGMAWSPARFNNKLVIRSGFGLFYNPMEQLVLEQFQGEPPFGGSNSIGEGLFQTPFVSQGGSVSPNAFNGFLNPARGSAVDWSVFRPIILYGELQPNLRTQYTEQYNLQIQQQFGNNFVYTLGYVGSQGHRLLATYDLNHGNPQTCLDLIATSAYNNDSSYTCGPYYEDTEFIIPAGETIAPQGLHLPYGPTPFIAGGTTLSAPINLVGTRQYSSPYCDPTTGSNCPADGIPVFSSIFAQDVVANSNYNSLQASLEKRFSNGFQFLGAYTWSKSIDNASSFEQSLDPTDFSRSRALSLYGATNRFVFSGVWDLPFKKYSGVLGVVADGWTVSAIVAFQDGFPIRMQSNLDQELQGSGDFENPGKPDIVARFTHQNPRTNNGYYFNPSIFAVAPLGSLGSATRSQCCGPGIDNTDLAFQKNTPIGETKNLQFIFQTFNVFNHTQFLNPDGQIGDGGLFGQVTRARDPRKIQFAIRFSM